MYKVHTKSNKLVEKQRPTQQQTPTKSLKVLFEFGLGKREL